LPSEKSSASLPSEKSSESLISLPSEKSKSSDKISPSEISLGSDNLISLASDKRSSSEISLPSEKRSPSEISLPSDKRSSSEISLASDKSKSSESVKSLLVMEPIKEKSSSSLISVKEESVPVREKSSSSLISVKEESVPVREKSSSSLISVKEESVPVREKSSSSLISVKEESVPIREKSSSSLISVKEEEPVPIREKSSSSLISVKEEEPVPVKERTPIDDYNFEFLSDSEEEPEVPVKRVTTPLQTEMLEERTPTPISVDKEPVDKENMNVALEESVDKDNINVALEEPVDKDNTNVALEETVGKDNTNVALEEEEIIPVIKAKGKTVVIKEPSVTKRKTILIEEEEEEPGANIPLLEEDEEAEYIDVVPKISATNQKKIEDLKKGLRETAHDIAGTQLNNPYFFQNRMQQRDPGLFVTMKEGSMMAYSRMCPSNVKRQPVILTEEEKNDLIDEHQDIYGDKRKVESDFVEYRHNPENPDEKYYYTCPRYWCLLTDKMVTKKQIMDGECGGVKYDENTYKNAIIPKNAKKVPKGQYVYQFYDEGVEHFPGFHKENTQDGNCIPCCYTKWNTAAVKERRDKCQAQSKQMTQRRVLEENRTSLVAEGEGEEEEIIVPQAKPVNLKTVITGKEQYIKGPEIYPLGNKRWGFMPVAIERLLHESSASCKISQTNTNIKVGHPCLLRHGVEDSMKQSFIACIASALFYAESIKDDNGNIVPRILQFDPAAKDDVPSIAKMKELILNAITLDSFITYQNGDLITTFSPYTGESDTDTNTDIVINMEYVAEKYGESKLYNKYRKYVDTSSSEFYTSSSESGIEIQTNSSVASEAITLGGSLSGSKSSSSLINISSIDNDIENIDIDIGKSSENINVSDSSRINMNVASDSSNVSDNSISSSVNVSVSDNSSIGETNEEKFILNAVKSFENFKKFLDPKNTTTLIDHTYLWDIVTRPNPRLFNSGFNLVIFEITDNDITNNVELLCPTNHYSNQVYVARRKTLILIKRENIFEPIYSYLDTGKKLRVVKMFSEYDPTLAETSKSMRAVLNTIIKPLLSNQCAALPSLPSTIYKFKTPPTLSALIKQLDKRRYTIETQVVNFQGKVIGVMAESRTGLRGYIPCYPSSLCVPKYPNKGKECRFDFIYMDEVQWRPYKETLAFLKEFYRYEEPQNSDQYVKCNEGTDLCKVVEDNHIVGILTNTNQFVQISEVLREDEIRDNIRSINNNNFLLADENTLVNKDVDTKRIEYIRRIQLETNFYNVFRNTIRILLGDYVNNDKRIKLQKECNNRYALYNDKLEIVIDLLVDLVGENIIFSDNFNVSSIKDIFTCLNISDDKCRSSTGNSVCFMTNDKCTLVLPNINLITKQPTNKVQYYGRMADELIRYNRIKSYIFKSKSFLSFNKIGYNLRDDEIIILQSLLTQEFFEELVSSNKSKYAKFNSYDTTNPIKSLPYVNEYSMDAIINPHELNECERSRVGKITSIYWRKCFPSNYKEKKYFGLNDCTFNIVIDIIANVKGQQFEIDKLRSILNEEYYRLTNGFTNKQNIQKIADILSEEGKKLFADQLVQQILSFTEMVYTYSYFITNFDLWVLLSFFKINSIFISNVNIPETRYNEKQFVVFTDESSDDYVFIMTPGLRERNVPEYGIIINDRDQMLVNYDSLKQDSECTNKLDEAIRAYVSIDEYLNVYKRDNKYKYVKKRKDLRKKPIALLEEGDVLEKETPTIALVEEEVRPTMPLVEVEGEEEFIVPVKRPTMPLVEVEEGEEEFIVPVIKPTVKAKAKPRARKPVPNLIIEGEEEGEEEVKAPPVNPLIVDKPFVKEPEEIEEEIIVPIKRKFTKKKVEIRPQETKKFTRKAPKQPVLILEEVDEL
jgi:hypothetical protein